MTESLQQRHPANYVSAAVRLTVAAFASMVVIGAVIAGGAVALLTFTVQSNAMIAISFIWTAWALITDRRTPPEWLAASAVFYIAITGLVFNTVISPGSFRSGTPALWGLSSSDYAHAVIPLVAMLVWLIFEEHRRIPWRYAGIWLIYLVVYITVVGLLVATVDSIAVPYRFLDVAVRGWPAVLTSLLGLLVVFVALAFAMVGADRLLPARTRISEYDRFDEYWTNPRTVTQPLEFSGGTASSPETATSIP